MPLSDISKRDWRRAAVAGALIGGVITGTLSWTLSVRSSGVATLLGFVIGASLFGFLLTLVGSVNVKLNDIRETVIGHVGDTRDELRSMANVRPLLDEEMLLQFGGYAMSAHFAEVVLRLLMQERPKLVVECGSGSSTLLVASRLKKFEGGDRRVIALDHEEKYADITRDLLSRHNLNEWAEVYTAPLESWQINDESLSWYGIDLDVLPDRKIDMLVVDGPPAESRPLARYPAIPVLKRHLSKECIIILDDGDRSGESEAAHRWAEELGCELEYAGGARGTWILHRDHS
ncbi:class I SAM-dependent methyltransferase [Salinibacter ruber]|uniref:class I SAM-dependent methyltransferase n=1 Tax=Salinibacter ruber TaxID=146919 RepID=UPI0020749108|nr:class I SAM-dependent methyltransferase [Salinibacter ruber]